MLSMIKINAMGATVKIIDRTFILIDSICESSNGFLKV